MIIGIPKEILAGEKRVSATPETVKKMISDGHEVLVEKNAGEGSYYHDEAYRLAGASIIDNPQEVFHRSDVVLKVKEPQYNKNLAMHEVDMMRKGQTLITFLHPASPANHQMIKNLAKKGITALTLDGVPRISRAQSMDALSSMSSCAGYKGMLMAANSIPKFMPMVGSAVGMIRPATVIIVGTGVAGLRALATAKGLGAVVYSTDVRPEANKQAASLGARVIDLEIPEEVAISKDGVYAKYLPEKWLKHEIEKIKEIVKSADIVFLTALVFGKKAPILIDEELVKQMKPGAYIVDVSIDQGGNCALTEAGKIIVKHNVTIDGTKNIPGMIPTSSTWLFANNVYNLFKYIVKEGKISLDLNDEIINSILVCQNGEILHQGTLEAMKE